MSKSGQPNLSFEETTRQRDANKKLQAEKREASRQRMEEEARMKSENASKAASALKKHKSKSFWAKYGQYIIISVASAVVLLNLNYPMNKANMFSDAEAAEIPVVDDGLISAHNEKETTYQIGHSQMWDGVSMQDAKRYFQNSFTKTGNMPKCPASKNTTELPASYNWHHAHSNCFKLPVNQGLCSSSWAVATAGAFTDRYCGQTGDKSYKASAQQLLTCEKKQSSGCERGTVTGAMEHGRTKGFVSADCLTYKPYDVALDCNWSEISKCPQKEKVGDYCTVEGADAIKREIMTNGPVVSLMPVYRDLLLYKEGIYAPTADTMRIEGNQALKIVGWGAEGKHHYWLVENSFGDEWGSSGTGKIKMGVHDSQLDKVAVAAYPAQEEAQ